MSRACAGCLQSIQPEEMVMWIRDHVTGADHVIYHARCFACARCDGGRPLSTGEHYGIQDGRVYCRAHYCERQMELRQVRAGGGATGRRTGTRGRPRKLRTAVRPPAEEPSPRPPCDTGLMTTDTEPRTFHTSLPTASVVRVEQWVRRVCLCVQKMICELNAFDVRTQMH